MTDEQFVEIKTTLSRVETQLETLVGNGQPGLIKVMQDDIKDLQKDSNIRTGGTVAFGFLVTGWEFFKHFAQKF